MKTSDFDYDLPPEYIAQTPIEPRDASRLLVMRRKTGELDHAVFSNIGHYLHPGDLLVLNQTRVIPARIYARKPTGGRVEILLLRRENLLNWECLVGGKGLATGKLLQVEGGPEVRVLEVLDGSRRRMCFSEPIEPYLPSVGNVPLPPYIHEKLLDPERYQTVYAREPGSAAAPTAGLHFTPRLLDELQEKGVRLAYVTLHVGLDTFAPVTESDPAEHQIHTEWCELNQAAADEINRARAKGCKVVAVGTTSVRTLESAAAGSAGGTGYPPLFRQHQPVYHPGICIQACGCHGHQFPPAQIHPDHAGQRICRQGKYTACLFQGQGRRVPFLFLR